MTIEFGYDKPKVIQALRYHFLNRKEIKGLVIAINLFALVSAVFFALKQIQPFAFLLFSMLWFVLMIVIWRLLPASIYRRSATFRDHFTMDLNENDFVLHNNRGQRAWNWNEVKYFLESPHFFHLYFDDKAFFLVPKDAMTGDPDTIAVRSFLSTKIKKG